MAKSSPRVRTAGLREVARDAARERIAAVALDLVIQHGFDAVTVEQIAGEVGISARTFHRYFPAKEDAVIGEAAQWLDFIVATLSARPADEGAWLALRATFEDMMRMATDSDERSKAGMRLVMATPVLRARNYQKHLQWVEDLTPLVAKRLGGDEADRTAGIVLHAALACFDGAMEAWAQPAETRSPLSILASTFDALEGALHGN